MVLGHHGKMVFTWANFSADLSFDYLKLIFHKMLQFFFIEVWAMVLVWSSNPILHDLFWF